MGLAFSMEEAGKGARGLAQILSAVPEAEARTSLLQSESKLRSMDVENILAAGKAAKEPTAPIPEPKMDVQSELFGNTAAAIDLNKDLTNQRQQLDQAKRILNSMPNPGTAAYRDQEVKVERMTRDLEGTEAKLMGHQEKVGAANQMFLEGISDQESLEGAHAALQDQLGRLFDAKSGVPTSDPAYQQKRAQFVKDNDTLPDRYDPAGEAKLEMLKSRGATSLDNLKLMQLRRGWKSDQLKLQGVMANAASRERAAEKRENARGTEIFTKLIETDRKNNKDSLDKIDTTIKTVEAELSDMQNPLKYTPPKHYTFLGDETPEWKVYQDTLDGKRALLAAYKNEKASLQKEQRYLGDAVEKKAFGGKPLREQQPAGTAENPIKLD